MFTNHTTEKDKASTGMFSSHSVSDLGFCFIVFFAQRDPDGHCLPAYVSGTCTDWNPSGRFAWLLVSQDPNAEVKAILIQYYEPVYNQ
jgi:hypothetical protein